VIVSSGFSLVTGGPARGGDDEHADGTKARILVVEDDPNTRSVLVLLLELRGYRVLQAEDGESGVEVAFRVGADLVVSDLQLPRMSGLELARTITRHDGHPPVIAITAGDESLVRRAKESRHFVEILRKPIDVGRLLDLADSLTDEASS
jgi:CheY-like chemotaxis protein